MTDSKELEVIILYTLATRGGKVATSRALEIIQTSGWVKEKLDDEQERSSVNESKLQNDLRWTRNRLREHGELDGSQPGVWIITEEGRKRLHKIASNAASKSDAELTEIAETLERYTIKFLSELRDFGKKDHS
jgi:hypothetical protein